MRPVRSPAEPRDGISAMAKIRIPIPPIQCVNERQNNIPLGRLSTSERIDAPVVEKPEHDSKNASAKPGMLPVVMKGMAPNMADMIQQSVTIRNPSLTLSC